MRDFAKLLKSRRAGRGSKPRCHLLTDGPRDVVAQRLTRIVAPFAEVSATDRWMPQGFADIAEPELDKAAELLNASTRGALARWWLPEAIADARTPNFDIAGTCSIEGKRGLMLVEAKAHCAELRKETAGRRLSEAGAGGATIDARRRLSHGTIGMAIEEARKGLSAATDLRWGISRDSGYQMSNRFAWSWKLTQLGIPVVLVYLGFLNADEMNDQSMPFRTDDDWKREVMTHSADLVPDGAWGRLWTVAGQPFVPLIRSSQVALDT